MFWGASHRLLLLMEEILHLLIGSLSHYLQGFLHTRWCRISSINSPNSFQGSLSFCVFFASRICVKGVKCFKLLQVVSGCFFESAQI